MAIIAIRKLNLYIGSDNIIKHTAVVNNESGAYVNDATVTMTLKDSAGTNITNAVDLPLAYVAASNGNYAGNIPDTVTAGLTENATYYLYITSVSGSAKVVSKIQMTGVYHS